MAGGIDAIDLQAGTLLWSSDGAARPLLAFDDKLAALAADTGTRNAFRVVVLDTHSGRVLLTADPFEVPEWVTAGAGGESFRIRAELHGESLRVTWSAQARYTGGANPPPHVLRQANKDASGAVRVELGTGRVESAAMDAQSGTVGDDPPPAAVAGLEPSAQEIHIVGSRVFYVAEAAGTESLKACDLASGQVVWERTLGTRRAAKPRALRP
jgi:hypothetical protein